MSIEFALREGPQPEKTYRCSPPCPRHDRGDEARLDFLASGWDGTCQDPKHKHRCKVVWRFSTLCDALHTEFFCDRALPAHLRRLAAEPRVAGVAKPAGAKAHGRGAVAVVVGTETHSDVRI